MTTPTVPNFITGFGPQQSDLQSLWVNPATFFRNRVVFRASQTTTATTLPSSGAYTTIAYDNILEDPYSGWSASTHQWTAPAGYSGLYLATVTVWVTGSAAGVVLAVLVGGSPQVQPATASPTTGSGGTVCSDYGYLTGGQDAMWGSAAIINSGANLSTSLTAGQNSTLEVIWISS